MSERIERVALVVHSGREGALEGARELIAWFRERGVETSCLEGEPIEADHKRRAEALADGIDLVVSIGGDGTLLRAAHVAYRADAPLVGVKVGRLGFLTELEPSGAPGLLAQVLEGKMVLDERTALVAEPSGAPWTEPQWALNEVIVEKRARHRLITLRAMIGDEDVATFSADGVIVATPTGSTAYSFSARGPIVSPKVACFVLTPVSPHMVFDRSVVVAPEEGIVLEVLGDEPGLLSADGRLGLELPLGARIRIHRAERPVRLVRRPGSPSFFALLREKFSLPGEAPHGAARPRHEDAPPEGSGVRPGR